jgi:hypothetical protein
VPDRRPRGCAGAADELVEELDREKRRDESRSATPGGSGSGANGHAPILANPPAAVDRFLLDPIRGGIAVPSKSANVKNEKQYEKLKEKGMSKERAAKIANSPGASSRGGKASGSGKRRSNSSQGGTTAQKKAAGRKGGRASSKS